MRLIDMICSFGTPKSLTFEIADETRKDLKKKLKSQSKSNKLVRVSSDTTVMIPSLSDKIKTKTSIQKKISLKEYVETVQIYQKAIEILLPFAQKGNVRAMASLGEVYLLGFEYIEQGVKENEKAKNALDLGVLWLVEASMNGNDKAIEKLQYAKHAFKIDEIQISYFQIQALNKKRQQQENEAQFKYRIFELNRSFIDK